MIFGNGKNYKLQYNNSGWTDFHTATLPMTKWYKGVQSGINATSTIKPHGGANYEMQSLKTPQKTFTLHYIVKTEEDATGGSSYGTTVRGIEYFFDTVVANGDSSYIRIYPDVDNRSSLYFDVNIRGFHSNPSKYGTYDIFTVVLESRDMTNALT